MVVESLFHTVVTACCNDTFSELDFSCNLHDLPHIGIQMGYQQHHPCHLTPLLGRKSRTPDAQTKAPQEPPIWLVLFCHLSLF